MKSATSKTLFARSQQYIPGGVNSPVRAFRSVGGHPLFITRAQGATVIDADGNTYLDYVASWGPMILGHAHPGVVRAIQRAAGAGTSYGAPTQQELELARMICEAFPSVEKVRLVSSGTEAVMSAIRVARGFTKRDAILKFEGCYHGHADHLLVKAGSGAATLGLPDSPGVPKAAASQTLTAPYNDIESVKSLVQKHWRNLACIIVEPVAGNMGVVLPRPRLSAATAHPHQKTRYPPDLRRSDFRISRGLWRRADPVRHRPRSHVPGKNHRRRAAGGRLRRVTRDHGSGGAGRSRVPGRDLVRESRWP